MSQYARLPIFAIFGTLMALVIIIAAVLLLSSTGIGGAGTSTGLVSTSTNLQAALPFIAILIAGGIAVGAATGKG